MISGGVSVSRQTAKQTVYAYTAWQLQLGYYRDLPLGFSASVQPSYTQVAYDSEYFAFGAVRRDRQLSAQVSLLNRRIDVWGFTPRLAYTYTTTASSIPFYAYDRQRVEMGLTRNF